MTCGLIVEAYGLETKESPCERNSEPNRMQLEVEQGEYQTRMVLPALPPFCVLFVFFEKGLQSSLRSTPECKRGIL